MHNRFLFGACAGIAFLGITLLASERALAAPGKALSAQAQFEAGLPETAPKKLSDLYKFFTRAVQEGLGTEVQSAAVRITGRSWELVRDGRFPEVELTLKPFEAQGLKFDKGGFLFKKLEIDKDALLAGKLKLKEVRAVESRLVFTLRSLARRMSDKAGSEIRLQADMEEQLVSVEGQGSFLAIPCKVESRCQFVWDESAKMLRLVPQEQSFGGHAIPRWLWWLGHGPVPKDAVLDLSSSWIPFNIQEVHVGWDQVNLSTNW
jgi:hypothetical protein